MSGSFGPQLPSPFPSANALLDMERLRQAPQLAEDAHQNALMTRQVHQQTLGTNQIEYVARASAAIDGVPEAEQPALYQQLGQQLVDAGIIPTLPPYPGPARIKQLASLGTPAKEQQQMASDAATMRALAPPAPGAPPAAPGAAAPVAPAADGGVPFAANNPLNIRFVGQQGASNTRGFAAFPTPEAGQAATDAQFASYADKGINTLTGLISRWAPPSENDTPAYIARVAQATGIDPNAPIDLRDPAQSRKIQQAMAAVEGNKNAVVPGAGGGVAARTGGTNVAGPPGTAPGAAVAASAVVPGTEFTADQARQLAVYAASRGAKPADYLAMQERFRTGNRADAAAARSETQQAQSLGIQRAHLALSEDANRRANDELAEKARLAGETFVPGTGIEAVHENTVQKYAAKVAKGQQLTDDEQRLYDGAYYALQQTGGQTGVMTDPNNAGQQIPFQTTRRLSPSLPEPKGGALPAVISQPGAAKKDQLNEGQGKAAGFADRIQANLPIITDTSPAAMSRWQQMLGQAPLVGNSLVTEEFQQHMQAERDFINAVLRRESGASIQPSEFESARKQYIPQPGDGPKVLEQKARNRETVLNGMIREAGSGYKPPAASAAPATGGWTVKRLD